jgi:hypothetical protein
MPLNFYTLYTLKAGGQQAYLDGLLVRGPSSEDGKNWIFFTDEEAAKPILSLSFKSLRDEDKRVVATLPEGGEIVFNPVTIDAVRERPTAYGLTPEEAANIVRPSDLQLWLYEYEVPEWYTETYAPAEEQTEDSAEIEADYRALREAKEAPPGTVHYWQSRDEYYMKYPDGSWKQVKKAADDSFVPAFSEGETWKDSDPSLPTDSLSAHIVNGRLTPERQRLHNRVLDKLFAGKRRTANPVAVITMGLPASGKSALSTLLHTQPMEEDIPTDLVVLDPDKHRESIPEYTAARALKAKNAAKIVHNEVTQLNDEALERAMTDDPRRPGERYSFVLDGVGGNAGWYAQTIDRLKQRGYTVKLLMAHAKGDDQVSGKDLLKMRAEARGRETGRFIDNAMIDRLHSVLPQNFRQLEPLVDEAAVFDTTDVGQAALIHSSEKLPDGTISTAGTSRWWQEAKGSRRVMSSMEEAMTDDFKKLCDLYTRALNLDATTERKQLVPAGQGYTEPLLDPVAVSVETPAAQTEAKVGTIKMVKGSFYEYQGNGIWTKADWFP